jgi:hypothetical protein
MKTVLFALTILCSASVASAQWGGGPGYVITPSPLVYGRPGFNAAGYGYRGYGYAPYNYGGYGYGAYGNSGYVNQMNVGNITFYNGTTPWTGPFHGTTYHFGNQSQTYFQFGW